MRSTTDPTPAEIKQQCREIQRHWSHDERQRRAGCYAVRPVVAVVVEVADLRAAVRRA